MTVSPGGTGTIDVASLQTLTIKNPLTGVLGNLIKSGAGTLLLRATPTYTGTTTINGGIIGFQSGAGLPANGLTIGAGGGTLDYYTSTPDITNGQTVTLNGTLTIDVIPAAINVAFATPPNLGGGGAGGLTKVGLGILTLTNSAATGATYTGQTTLSAGTLALNFGAQITPILPTAAQLNLQGGTLSLTGGSVSGAATQSFANTVVSLGATTITLALGSATSVTLNTGVITRTGTGQSTSPRSRQAPASIPVRRP
ncbi:MAG: autotransporter-associated beta strand repeat-containing protein [Chthoniobacter sp.]